MSEINKAASTHLGSSASYAVTTTEPDPSLLVRMPREEARGEWNIDSSKFVGVDVWIAHEATFLMNNGYPVSGTLKIVYPCDSKWMVESKSLKLYLNTYDMSKIGDHSSLEHSTNKYVERIQRDLEKLLQCDVVVSFFNELFDEYKQFTERPFSKSYRLIDRIAVHSTGVVKYDGSENYLKVVDINEDVKIHPLVSSMNGVNRACKYYTNLLRSRCRHTKQKDTGSAYIHIRAKNELQISSLLDHIVSLREVNEFHEFCGEKIFRDIFDTLEIESGDVKDLMVTCMYVRRGGIDISPVRATSWDLIPEVFIRKDLLPMKTVIQ